jgi:hypothetical protein
MSISNDKSDSHSDNPPILGQWPWTLTEAEFRDLIEKLAATSPHLAERLGHIAIRLLDQQESVAAAVPVLIRA